MRRFYHQNPPGPTHIDTKTLPVISHTQTDPHTLHMTCTLHENGYDMPHNPEIGFAHMTFTRHPQSGTITLAKALRANGLILTDQDPDKISFDNALFRYQSHPMANHPASFAALALTVTKAFGPFVAANETPQTAALPDKHADRHMRLCPYAET